MFGNKRGVLESSQWVLDRIRFLHGFDLCFFSAFTPYVEFDHSGISEGEREFVD